MKKTTLIFLFVISIPIFASILNPFGNYTNPGLVLEQNFYLAGTNFYVDLLFKQDLLTIKDLNILLNKGILNLNNIKKISFYSSFNSSAYGTFKLGGFAVSPFFNVEGNLGLFIPDEIKDFILNRDIEIDNTYEYQLDDKNKFLLANSFSNMGLTINLGKFFVAPYLYIPILYTPVKNEQQTLYFKYTSSSSPAEIYFNLDGKASIYSILPLDQISSDNFDLNNFINSLDANDLGVSLSIGYNSNNFGFSINNVKIKPSNARYKATLTTLATLTYEASDLDISSNFEATAILENFQENSIYVFKVPNISGYLQTSGKIINLGVRGNYVLDNTNLNWKAGLFVNGNFKILYPYYFIDYINPAKAFVHTIGSEFDIHIIYLNINLKLISRDISPFNANSFGLSFSFGFGI
ncbi:hypothetical protein HNP65_000728 [Thermosipho japonicus]|uniref:DUF5723 domain-containing protein n=1 Tax=Thermosipho japonicus TaxID=90323 RepID=A0A841GFA5_9BACT|nr:hypothetical protein [Thermosipho japonicus]MBB6062306.1 hypothetical protein [Thermosipho japonicus]